MSDRKPREWAQAAEINGFVRDVARFAPKPSDSLEYSRGVLSTLTRRAEDLVEAGVPGPWEDLAAAIERVGEDKVASVIAEAIGKTEWGEDEAVTVDDLVPSLAALRAAGQPCRPGSRPEENPRDHFNQEPT